jgi:Xaa-Pro aminopeptidase
LPAASTQRVPGGFLPIPRCRALLEILAVAIISSPAAAQVPLSEYTARRSAVAARIDSGVVIAFGGVEPVTDWPGFSDVTGTMPVNGKFSPAQREIYQIVRDAQEAFVRQIKVG